MFIFKPLTSKH